MTKTCHKFKTFIFLNALLMICSIGSGIAAEPIELRLNKKSQQVKQLIPLWVRNGGSVERIQKMGAQVKELGEAGKAKEAEAVLDRMLRILKNKSGGTISKPLKSRFAELIVSGDRSKNGIFDPSLEYDKNGVGWMAYSGVDAGQKSTVSTKIAKSNDKGKTWRYLTTVNPAYPGRLNIKGKLTDGIWWSEVSTLVNDPKDSGREWKLFWHNYFSKVPHTGPKDRKLEYGWIAYKYASNPKGPWSKTIRMFGAGPFPLPPYKTKFNVKGFHPDLRDYSVLTEPGSLCFNDTLYLSFQAVKARGSNHPDFDIILLSSKDHGQTWSYAGKPLVSKQAIRFGGKGWTGSSLAVSNGKPCLLVCPEDTGNAKTGHKGTVIFQFKDISKGKLVKSKNGNPKVIAWIKPDLAKGGQSDYDQQNINGGMVMPQYDRRNFPKIFRIFNTKYFLKI